MIRVYRCIRGRFFYHIKDYYLDTKTPCESSLCYENGTYKCSIEEKICSLRYGFLFFEKEKRKIEGETVL